MDMNRTLRPSQVLLWVGILFFTVPSLMAYLLVQSFPTQGVTINGVLRHDSAALAMPFALFGVFWLVSLLMMAYARFSRVVLTPTGIDVYNIFNQSSLAASWSDITGISRSHTDYSNSWTLHAHDRQARVGWGYEPAPLLQALAAHVPKERWQESVRLAPSRAPVAGPTRSGQDLYAMVFSALWYGILLVFAAFLVTNHGRTASVNGVPQGGPHDWYPLGAMLLVFAALPLPLFAGAWFRYLNGSIDADENRVVFCDGRSSREMKWADLLVASDEVSRQYNRSQTYNRYRNVGGLVLVSAQDALTIPVQIPQFADLGRLISAVAPEGAHVYLYAVSD